MADAAPAPPPPPPDLNAVWRPDEDTLVRKAIVEDPEAQSAVPAAATFEEVLGLAPAPRPAEPAPAPAPAAVSEAAAFEDVLGLRPKAQPTGPLIDLLDGAPQGSGAGLGLSEEGGLLARLPPGVPSPASLDKAPAVVDLSMAAAAEEPAAAPANVPGAAAGSGAGAIPGGGGGTGLRSSIPTEAKGFGSEDLFGKGPQERTIKDEAVAALSTVYEMLPDQVKDQAKPFLPACIEPTVQDRETEEVVPPPAASRRSSEAPLLGGHDGTERRGSGLLEEQHAQAAVNRACNGKWVPTYMRQQLAQNGHLSLPSGGAPNAHEHQADAPPPSLGQAFAEMGEELGESAQTMLTFVLAFLSSLATQCQMCTHQAASTVHEQVITCGENVCNGGSHEEQFEDHVMMGRPLDEAAAGLGPVRSQLRQHLQVGFARVVDIAKRKLVTPDAPLDFQRFVKARELSRHIAVPDARVEDWLFTTELHKEALPEVALPHLCASMGPLVCHETWHVEMQEERAEVEMSSAPANGPVTVVLRLEVTGKPAAEGGGCNVESRLFVRTREHGLALPLGLVEQLSQVHQAYTESLRNAVISLALQMGAEEPDAQVAAKDGEVPPSMQCTAPKDGEPLPVVPLSSLPEKRAPSWAAEGGAPEKRGVAAGLALAALQHDKKGGVDASLLLQVADGI